MPAIKYSLMYLCTLAFLIDPMGCLSVARPDLLSCCAISQVTVSLQATSQASQQTQAQQDGMRRCGAHLTSTLRGLCHLALQCAGAMQSAAATARTVELALDEKQVGDQRACSDP